MQAIKRMGIFENRIWIRWKKIDKKIYTCQRKEKGHFLTQKLSFTS